MGNHFSSFSHLVATSSTEPVETENFEDYLGIVGAGEKTADMIMKAEHSVSLRREEDRQWRIRSEVTFKAKSRAGIIVVPPKVVENKYLPGEPKRELLQDWDLREVETVLEYVEGSSQEAHGHCCETSCPSTVSEEGAKLTLSQVSVEGSQHPCDLVLVYSLQPGDNNILLLRVLQGDTLVAPRRFKRKEETGRRLSVA